MPHARHTDDRRPVPRLLRRIFGRLFGDKGYISQALAEQLFLAQGLRLITKLRKNMHNVLMDPSDKVLLRKRALIEIVCTQMTKTDVLACGSQGEDVADLHVPIGHDHTVNE